MPQELNNNPSDDLAISFSSNLVGVLKKKVRLHNKDYPESKVSYKQLKEVFVNASNNYCYAGYTRGQWALARVNTFLRIVHGDKPEIIKDCEYSSLGGLVFESKVIEVAEYDVSEKWVPSQEDFSSAKEEMEKEKLNYNFTDIDQLYLDDYKSMGVVRFQGE